MALKVGINGFGRIGRMVFRAAAQDPNIEFVGINDLVPPDNLAYLLRYDTVHGPMTGDIHAIERGLVVNDKFVSCFAEHDPAGIPWDQLGVDYVVESTGLFTDHHAAASHTSTGAKRVVISAPTKTPDQVKTLVLGVNHHEFDPDRDQIVSMASCTTNCLAPLVKVIADQFGFDEGLMSTIHAATATQPTQDGPSRKDWRGGRNAYANIIPASTGAAKAVGLVLPEVKGKLTGMAFRVPVANVSVVDLTVRTQNPTTYEDICQVLRQGATGDLQGILGISDDEVVSSDFIGSALSSIVDAGAGIGLSDRFFKLVSWYDNEWGYANRIIDLLRYMAVCDGLLTKPRQTIAG